MSPIKLLLTITIVTAALAARAQDATNLPPGATTIVTKLTKLAPADPNAPPAAVSNAATSTVVVTSVGGTNVVTTTTSTNGVSTTTVSNSMPADDMTDITPTNQIRMNFHDAPLSKVISYLSKKMGLVVATEVELHGTATIVSEQPVGTNEVISLLSAALAKNNYAVATNGRILTVTSADGAMTGSGTPVRQAASPADIPVNDEMATYILPVHTLNPTQLIKDLDQLIPSGAKVSANEAGNAILMTARQKDIHRISEIITALDGSSVAEVEVYPLKYADAKAVAAELKEVFQSPDSSVARSDARTRFRGGGGFGGFGGFGGGGGPGGDSGGGDKNAANKAVFVSDDQMNAVVASAPPDYFRMITNVIFSLDQPSSDVTVIRTFKLRHADAQETADMLANLFPDTSNNNDQNQNRGFGPRFFNPFMQQPSAGNNTSDRMKRQTTVRAVPDLRTASVIVTTSSNLMEQIAGVIETLDHDPAQEKHLYSFQIDSADPQTVQQAMAALFAVSKTSTQATTSQSALQQRVQSGAQQQQTSSSSSGFGSANGGAASLR